MSRNPIIWQPGTERVQSTAMCRFMHATGHDNYASLYQWSIDQSAAFWEALCDFCEVSFERNAHVTLARPNDIMDAGWFSGSQLNYAAHLLRHGGEEVALIFFGENGVRRELSRDELREQVSAVAAALRAAGVTKGDRVGAYLPNCPETVIAMLATTSIGAIWSSCSPDFGVNGIVDRFGEQFARSGAAVGQNRLGNSGVSQRPECRFQVR